MADVAKDALSLLNNPVPEIMVLDLSAFKDAVDEANTARCDKELNESGVSGCVLHNSQLSS